MSQEEAVITSLALDSENAEQELKDIMKQSVP
jgi:hypothetical protein